MKAVKYIMLVAAVVGFVAFFMFFPDATETPTTTDTSTGLIVGNPAPNFQLMDLEGNAWRLSDLRGAVVIINFWASWCPPCKKEMPSLNRLFEETIQNPSLAIVTILYNDEPGNGEAFMKSKGFGLPVLVDHDGSIAARYGITGVPETYIVDKKGILRKKIIGPAEFDSPDAFRFFEQLIAA